MTPTLAGVLVYPVKSCRGIEVDAALVGERGLLHDRQWMIVEPPSSPSSPQLFVTQREYPRLALIHVRITDRALVLSTHPSDAAADSIEIALDGEAEDGRHGADHG